MKNFIFILALFFIVNTFNALGQSKNYYRKIKNSNQKSIEYSKKLLAELNANNTNTLDELYLIRNELTKRKSTISIINNELRLLSEEIDRHNSLLQESYFQLENQKNEYAKLIYYSYLNLSVQQRMLYLLSANSFTSVYKRIIYLQQLTDYRKTKYKEISSSIYQIDSSLALLSNLEIEKKALYEDKINERDSLIGISNQLNRSIVILKLEIEKIDVSEKKEEIKKEIINSNVKVEISKNISNYKKTDPPKNIKFGKLTGKDFSKYKKQHLWPLKKFVLIHKFGNYPHPVLNDIILKNDGVELAALANSDVYSIYNGLVVNIIPIPGNGHSILIRHGMYYSVYSKVGKVYVSVGENVSRGKRIAQLKNDQKMEKLIFQIWKGKEKLNPEKWLTKF